MLSGEDKRKIKHQTKAMSGQLTAIQKMLDEDRDGQDIYLQFKALEGLLNKALYTLLDELFRKQLASTMVKVMDDCYSEDCPHCNNLESVRAEFSRMEIGDVIKNLGKLDNCFREEQ